MATLSIAMIVKNEEKVISRCLEGLEKLADEIVIVDTGSTDKTKEIAKSFSKVKLFDSEKFNKETHYSDFEFGVARNEAISRCKGDWVMWFDADDVVEDSSIAIIKELIAKKSNCVYTFSLQAPSCLFEHTRLFRNGCGVCFDETHACHEYLDCKGLVSHTHREVVIHHKPVERSVDASDRNLAILEKDFYKRGRNDSRTLFYLANSYRERNKCVEAINFYGKYLAVSVWAEERFFARYYNAQCLHKIGKIEESIAECYRAMAEDIRFAEPHCLLGDILATKGANQRAALCYRMALEMPMPKNARLFVNPSIYNTPNSYTKRRLDDMNKMINPSSTNHEAVVSAVDVVEKRRKLLYLLPDSKDTVIFALSALNGCAKASPDCDIEVVVDHEWQRKMNEATFKLREGKGENPLKLELPVDLKGKSSVDWYCRSAGFVVTCEPIPNKMWEEARRMIYGH